MILQEIYDILIDTYGPQGWWPVLSEADTPGFDSHGYHRGIHNNRYQPEQQFEIITGAILTQNTNWRNVERSLAVLFEKKLFHPEKIVALKDDELGEYIRSSGYFNQKAKKLKILSRFLLDRGWPEKRDLPSRKELLALWGIGPETADSILLYVFHYPVFVIDAYTKRLLVHMGIIDAKKDYHAIQNLFHTQIPANVQVYNEYHALIVEHGKNYCKKTPACTGCPLVSRCQFTGKGFGA